LAVLALDPETQGTLCLEEPENGIHPERIPAMIRLLQELATDTQAEIGADNPLRQVIINTHSPGVVTQIPEDSLLVAEPVQHFANGRGYQGLAFKCLRGTWRDKGGIMKAVALGRLLSYLNPSGLPNPDRLASIGMRRVIDREDLGQYRLFSENIL
jgi:hypothetical protein